MSSLKWNILNYENVSSKTAVYSILRYKKLTKAEKYRMTIQKLQTKSIMIR